MHFVKVICMTLSVLMPVYGSQCSKVFSNHVSDHDKHVIVDKHNEVRRLIANGQVAGQPRGVNLKRMKYDESLAAQAQNIANSCEFAHKTVHDGRWFAVGQNLYISYSTAYDGTTQWDQVIQSWFDEHKQYQFGSGFSTETGHYTQLVWAETEFVGCGYVNFSTNDFWTYRRLYVCNYGPAGNIIGRVPYETGSSGCENLC